MNSEHLAHIKALQAREIAMKEKSNALMIAEVPSGCLALAAVPHDRIYWKKY